MTEHDLTQEKMERLIEDLAYLQDESDAMQHVIDSVPHDDSPPDSYSIVDNLHFLDYLQVEYFRPLFESIAQKSLNYTPAPQPVSNFGKKANTGEEKPDVQKILADLSKNRAALIQIIRQIPLKEWNNKVYNGEGEKSVLEFTQDLLRADRRILKEIASLLMDFQKDHMAMRQVRNHSKRGSK